MTDKTIQFGQSVLQHGKFNNRVYLMKLSKADFPAIIDFVYNLAKENGYTKIFAKIPLWAKGGFDDRGYDTEAFIPRFFMGTEGACFMSFYFDGDRKTKIDRQKTQQIIDHAKNTPPVEGPLQLQSRYSHAVLTPNDADDLASVYKKLFETYPFPISDPEYIRHTMKQNVQYFGIKEKGRLVAASSCEMDIDGKNVEMTDFATLPEYRSKGLASFLLSKMENEMLKRGMLTCYTIARSLSYGMNITFAKHKYLFAGTLFNNTNISGSIESMNVWYKDLCASAPAAFR